LIGYRMTMPEARPLEIEQGVFTNYGLTPESFRSEGHHKVKGARRALRVRPTDVSYAGGVDDHGAHVTVAFHPPPRAASRPSRSRK
jgi:tRNA(Glu) U13 pseudouridine synthase TruD